jgi:peptidoglycan hydrolase-like protein with peptidoglycan-binding domain
MTNGIDTHNLDAMSGAMYFIVGKGTEGGPHSYELSVAGITGSSKPGHQWGDVAGVASDSGYSIGTIQVDLGKRGDWPLGATESRALQPGEKSYIDSVVDQSSNYARQSGLGFTSDLESLRSDLHTHGEHLKFIDKDTLTSINAWAASDDGKKWIHSNIDFPQAKNITEKAMSIVDQNGKNITEDHRLETIAILAKAENQLPGLNKGFERVLKDGGTYEDVLRQAEKDKSLRSYFDGPKAAAVAEEYAKAAKDPATKESLDRASSKVASSDYNPSIERTDADIKAALSVVGDVARVHRANNSLLKQGMTGEGVNHAQGELQTLGYLHDAPDSKFGHDTKTAVESFQRDHGLHVDGEIGTTTQGSLDAAVRDKQISDLTADRPLLLDFSDPSHPQNALYNVLRENLPRGTSEERLAQGTAACYMAGITCPDNLTGITIGASSVTFDTQSLLARPAQMDISQQAPSIQQTMQQIQQFDQQQAQIQAQVQQANQQANQQQGPVMGGPQMSGH